MSDIEEQLRLIYIESRGWVEQLKDVAEVPLAEIISSLKQSKYEKEEVNDLVALLKERSADESH